MPRRAATACPFCAIASGTAPAHVVHEDADSLAFLDTRPLLPGHVLLVPRRHVATLLDLPDDACGPLLQTVRNLSRAVQQALAADGSFVAMNTVVSQSIRHLHVHVVPRWQKDGLFGRGFVWLRRPYRDEAQMAELAERIRAALA